MRARTCSAGTDREGSLPVILINERLAGQFFGDSDPIGHRIRTGGMDSKGGEWATVVGDDDDVRYGSLELPAAPAYYVPYAQRPYRSSGTLLVHTQREPLALAEPVCGAIRAIDSDVAIDVRTLEERLSALLDGRRFMIVVLGVFAGTALLLAAAGIYAVVSFAIAQRTHEIGIRVALGAGRPTVLWVIARSTMLSVADGIVIGVAGAAWLSRFIAAMLFDVPALDPLTFTAVAAVLGATALVATLVPPCARSA